jgi:hypothetical protein
MGKNGSGAGLQAGTARSNVLDTAEVLAHVDEDAI